jgi:hypothetical protein
MKEHNDHKGMGKGNKFGMSRLEEWTQEQQGRGKGLSHILQKPTPPAPFHVALFGINSRYSS